MTTPAPNFALLHGGGQGGWVWDATAQALVAKGAHVLALDVPGCGAKRKRETIELGVEDVADELCADIIAAGLQDVILVGHSQAGTMLPVMALRHPKLFHKLIYLSCSAPLPGKSVIDQMGRGLHGANPDEVGWPLDPDIYGRDAQYIQMFCNDMDADLAATFMARPLDENWPMGVTYATHWEYDHLRDVPSTYIICERDGILPVLWQHRFAQRLHCDQILSIDAGHQAMMTQPVHLAEILLSASI